MAQRTRDKPVDPAVAALGRNLLKARKAAGMTQEAVALAAGMPTPEVSKIERGLQDPRLSTVVRLAGALGVEPSVLVN